MQCNYFIDIRIRKNTWLMAERGRGQKMVSQNQRCIYIVHIHFYATPRPPPKQVNAWKICIKDIPSPKIFTFQECITICKMTVKLAVNVVP